MYRVLTECEQQTEGSSLPSLKVPRRTSVAPLLLLRLLSVTHGVSIFPVPNAGCSSVNLLTSWTSTSTSLQRSRPSTMARPSTALRRWMFHWPSAQYGTTLAGRTRSMGKSSRRKKTNSCTHATSHLGSSGRLFLVASPVCEQPTCYFYVTNSLLDSSGHGLEAWPRSRHGKLHRAEAI